jgi:uncharacterized protein YndB with AHSA1/START domain
MNRRPLRSAQLLVATAALSGAPPAAPAVAATGARTIELHATVEASAADLYRLFTTSDGVRTLFPGAEAEIGDAVGGPYRVAFDPDRDPDATMLGTAGCRILALDPPREVAFEWRGPSPFAVMNVQPFPTRVRVRFEPQPGEAGTLVTLEHSGFGVGADWDRGHDFFVVAWQRTLDALRQRYATMPEMKLPERLGPPTTAMVALFRPGPAWVAGAPLEGQPGIFNHAAYMLQLMEAGVVWVGGHLAPGDDGIAILLGSRASAERYLRADPAVQSGLFRYELREWTASLPKEGVPAHGAPAAAR